MPTLPKVFTHLSDGRRVSSLPPGSYDTGDRRCAPIAYDPSTLTTATNVAQCYRVIILKPNSPLPLPGTGPNLIYRRDDGCPVLQTWCKL